MNLQHGRGSMFRPQTPTLLLAFWFPPKIQGCFVAEVVLWHEEGWLRSRRGEGQNVKLGHCAQLHLHIRQNTTFTLWNECPYFIWSAAAGFANRRTCMAAETQQHANTGEPCTNKIK